MKLLLVGKIGSGVEDIATKLQEKGMSKIKTYSTRPKWTDDDESHIFIEESDMVNYPDRCVETHFDGNTYFVTERQLEENDILVINPDSVIPLVEAHPDMAFMLTYVVNVEDGSTDNIRKLRANVSDDVFERRDALEADEFARFDEIMSTEKSIDNLPENIIIANILVNDWTVNVDKNLNIYMNTFRYQRNLQVIIRDCVLMGAIPVDENGYIVPGVIMTEDSDEPIEVKYSADILACKLMAESNSVLLQYFLSKYLSHTNLQL